MDTEKIPRSWLRHTVPTYKPAKTPYVGATVADFRPYRTADPRAVVIVREIDGSRGIDAGSYWIAPILADGTLGPMTVEYLTRHHLTAWEESPS